MTRFLFIFITVLFFSNNVSANRLFIPMDTSQRDHLRAYGLVYAALQQGIKAEIILNYRGGSFIIDEFDALADLNMKFGVTVEKISREFADEITKKIQKENIERLELEKVPKIAIYKPDSTDPWDDAVNMALDYAMIPYSKIWDKEVLKGKLSEYDWLHLHHEDFTGQHGKFYGFANNMQWYQAKRLEAEKLARELGYNRVAEQKRDVALAIQKFVSEGGFLFAMCSATDTLDIALAASDIDIVDQVLDGTPVTANYEKKLKFSRTFAFENFKLVPDPNIYEFSDIDVNPQKENILQERDTFSLFEFNAHIDPIPTLLTQNHEREIKGFLGQTTAFRSERIKSRVLILGQTLGTERVKYIYGGYAKGFFSFYGGHDPEDYQHLVGDAPTNLALHKNSPGYRLILNNIFLPAAKKKKLKT